MRLSTRIWIMTMMPFGAICGALFVHFMIPVLQMGNVAVA